MAVRLYDAELERHERIGTKYVKQAQFWLSDKPWQDLPTAQGNPASASTPDAYLAGLSDDRWRQYVRHWQSTMGDWDLKSRTPPPDHPRTLVPKHILTEFGIVAWRADPDQGVSGAA